MTRLQQLLMSGLIGSTLVLGACSSMTPSQQRVAAAAAGGATGREDEGGGETKRQETRGEIHAAW